MGRMASRTEAAMDSKVSTEMRIDVYKRQVEQGQNLFHKVVRALVGRHQGGNLGGAGGIGHAFRFKRL